jgi:HlyD family type I secretion membrane fusion protein
MSAAEVAAAALQPHLDEARKLTRIGASVVLLALIPSGTWMAAAPLASAVVAPAFVKVDLNRRPVQHAEGGIVREVRVRDGQRVAEGETLLILGDVAVDADRNRLDYRVQAEAAGIARLEAEQGMAQVLAFPADLKAAARNDARLAGLLAREQSLFDARRQALIAQTGLLREQRVKVGQELQALRQQIEQAVQSLHHQGEELAMHRNLQREGFISATRVSQLEAQVADYGVKVQERRSELARAEQRLVDCDLRIKLLESDYGKQASDQLKVALNRLSELQQEQRKTIDAGQRQVIVAPTAGDVIDLKVTAPGAVIPPRETIADIVPSAQRLVVEAHVRPEDIARVHRDQAAELRFTAFAASTTPLIAAKVRYVSADRLIDRQSGAAFYTVVIEADTDALASAGDLKLLAGMPAEAYITGETRTPLRYLLEPLLQVMRRAVRER